MSAALEDRLRRHYQERTNDLPTQGPGLDATPLIPTPRWHERHRRARRVRVGLALGLVAAVALGVVVMNRHTAGDGTVAVTGPSGTQVLAPVATLPAGNDVSDTPVTVAADHPTDWYRLQPDLDVAWYESPTPGSISMLCWRTPVDSKCAPDRVLVGSNPLTVPTAGGQTLVVTAGDTSKKTLDVQLSDGTVLGAPIAWDRTISWGVARYHLPSGASVTGVGTASSQAGDTSPVTGRTLPAAVDLSQVPVTVAAGGALSYWRWFPDLDISERETDSGSTELCWRTPAGTGCIDDTFRSPDVGIIPTDGGVIFLARPALVEISPPPSDPNAPKFELGPSPSTVNVTLSDGSTARAEVHYGAEFGLGYARLALSQGRTVVSARSQ